MDILKSQKTSRAFCVKERTEFSTQYSKYVISALGKQQKQEGAKGSTFSPQREDPLT